MPTEGAMNARFLVLGLMLAATAAAGAHESLGIKVSPAVSFAPANLIIRTSVDPDADNRSLEVVAESGDFYRSSTVMLEGDRAPRTTHFEFRSLPPGEYEVSMVVTGADGRQRAVSRTHAKVVESGAAR
jgi:methionine-rich copper-binding protein CopC